MNVGVLPHFQTTLPGGDGPIYYHQMTPRTMAAPTNHGNSNNAKSLVTPYLQPTKVPTHIEELIGRLRAELLAGETREKFLQSELKSAREALARGAILQARASEVVAAEAAAARAEAERYQGELTGARAEVAQLQRELEMGRAFLPHQTPPLASLLPQGPVEALWKERCEEAQASASRLQLEVAKLEAEVSLLRQARAASPVNGKCASDCNTNGGNPRARIDQLQLELLLAYERENRYKKQLEEREKEVQELRIDLWQLRNSLEAIKETTPSQHGPKHQPHHRPFQRTPENPPTPTEGLGLQHHKPEKSATTHATKVLVPKAIRQRASISFTTTSNVRSLHAHKPATAAGRQTPLAVPSTPVQSARDYNQQQQQTSERPPSTPPESARQDRTKRREQVQKERAYAAQQIAAHIGRLTPGLPASLSRPTTPTQHTSNPPPPQNDTPNRESPQPVRHRSEPCTPASSAPEY